MAEFSDLLVSSEVKVGVLHLSWFHRFVMTVIIWYRVRKKIYFFKHLHRKARLLTYLTVAFTTLFNTEGVMP
jgi:hypothetical protein